MPDERATDVEPPKSDGGSATNHNPNSTVDGSPPAKEIGGRQGPDPTRFGDWEKNGRCVDF